MHKELKKGTLNRIVDDAGMTVDDFSNLLQMIELHETNQPEIILDTEKTMP